MQAAGGGGLVVLGREEGGEGGEGDVQDAEVEGEEERYELQGGLGPEQAHGAGERGVEFGPGGRVGEVGVVGPRGAGAEAGGLTRKNDGPVAFVQDDGAEEDDAQVEERHGPEEPVPADVLGDDAAEDGADGGAEKGDEGHQREGLPSLRGAPAVGEDGSGDLWSLLDRSGLLEVEKRCAPRIRHWLPDLQKSARLS